MGAKNVLPKDLCMQNLIDYFGMKENEEGTSLHYALQGKKKSKEVVIFQTHKKYCNACQIHVKVEYG